MHDEDTPRELVVTPAGESPQQPVEAGAGFERLGVDLSNVITSLQSSIEQMRQAAQTEIGRLRSEHEAERDHLQGEIEQLRARCSNQDERVRLLQGQLRSALEDYRGELDMQAQRAAAARAQLDRVQALIRALEEEAAPDGDEQPSGVQGAVSVGTDRPRALPYVAPRRGAAVDSWQNQGDAGGSEDNTVQISTISAGSPTTQISIKGVTGVSAMMRARKAVEGLPSIQDIESRYVSDGTLYFSVRSEEDSRALADALTSLSDPKLRLLQVNDNSIDLEM